MPEARWAAGAASPPVGHRKGLGASPWGHRTVSHPCSTLEQQSSGVELRRFAVPWCFAVPQCSPCPGARHAPVLAVLQCFALPRCSPRHGAARQRRASCDVSGVRVPPIPTRRL